VIQMQVRLRTNAEQQSSSPLRSVSLSGPGNIRPAVTLSS